MKLSLKAALAFIVLASTALSAAAQDAEAGKATFVSLLGLSAAKAKAARLVLEAEQALCDYGPEADNLRELARFVIARKT